MKRWVPLLVVLGVAAGFAAAPKRISRSAACQERFRALCAVMHRCLKGAEDLGGPSCEAIEPGCEALSGGDTYDESAHQACVAGLEAFRCATKVDPNDLEAIDFEAQVPACRDLGR